MVARALEDIALEGSGRDRVVDDEDRLDPVWARRPLRRWLRRARGRDPGAGALRREADERSTLEREEKAAVKN